MARVFSKLTGSNPTMSHYRLKHVGTITCNALQHDYSASFQNFGCNGFDANGMSCIQDTIGTKAVTCIGFDFSSQ
eukprot:906724-Amphidinium_carterae.1